jgi:prepilin-type N-terminal cleavage/methylation domain-containing protein
MNIYKYKNQKGFTLVEMLVSVALFSIVMTIATSTIFSIIAGNRKAQAINSVVKALKIENRKLI